VDLHNYLKWRSGQIKAKDVTGIAGRAGQPWPVNPIKTSLLEARVVTAGKGGEGGKVLDNLTDTEGRTCRQDHENTQSKYSTLVGVVVNPN